MSRRIQRMTYFSMKPVPEIPTAYARFRTDVMIVWRDEPDPEREPSPGPEPGPEYQCGNCGYVSDKPGRCPRCGETI